LRVKNQSTNERRKGPELVLVWALVAQPFVAILASKVAATNRLVVVSEQSGALVGWFVVIKELVAEVMINSLAIVQL
jgi:hypothetical protein